MQLLFACCRPLTQEEIAERRAIARLRHAEKMAASSAQGQSVEKTDATKDGE